MVQKQLFQRLAQGTFSGHEFTTQVGATEADGSLLPVITELSFPLPNRPEPTTTKYGCAIASTYMIKLGLKSAVGIYLHMVRQPGELQQ